MTRREVMLFLLERFGTAEATAVAMLRYQGEEDPTVGRVADVAGNVRRLATLRVIQGGGG